MTPTEIQARCSELAAHIGGKAEVHAGAGSKGLGPHICIYPKGLLGERNPIYVEGGDDWAKMFADASAEWEKVSGNYSAKLIRDMSLAIIRLTADLGSCSDAALRIEFSADDIKQFGAQAVADANKIAANGPFSIRSTTGDNGAPDIADADAERQAAE